MAKKVTVTLIDDVDPNASADETVEFSLDGVQYEIDLSTANANRLRDELATWTAHARKISGRRRTRASSSRGIDREQTQAIRDWARRNGHSVSDRGRISASVMEAYNNAH